MALKWRTKILLAKIESSYGVDAVPTGAANAILATNIDISPMEGSDVSRELEKPYFGGDETIPTELHATMRFDVELATSGTRDVAPAWGPLLRGRGVAETVTANTSVVYNPVTAGHEAVTLYLMIESMLYALIGSRGNCKIEMNAQAIPKLMFEFTGLFVRPVEAARPTADISSFQKPLLVSNTNTGTFEINSTALVMRSSMLDLANQVEGRFLVGREDISITDRSDIFTTTVEAVPLSTLNPFQLAEEQADVDVSIVHGSGNGTRIQLDLPKCQMQRPQGLANAQNVKEWPLRMAPLATAGNDQWTLTLD